MQNPNTLIKYTLTTMTPNSPIWRSVELFDNAPAQPRHNSKTVECQLRLTLEKIAATEANIHMFMNLMSMDLATNDVNSFVMKQVCHKRVNSRPDLKVQKAAMKSKLIDVLSYAKRLRQQRESLRKRLVRRADSKSKAKKVVDDLLNHYHQTKKVEFAEANRKIEHIKWKDLRNKEIKTAPTGTTEFLSNVNVFKKSQKSLKPLDPEMPFICSDDIKLDSNELKLLARGPNFMIRDALDLETFNVELEKGIVKKKYDSLFSGKDDCSSTDIEATEEHGNRASAVSGDRVSCNSNRDNISSDKSELELNCNNLWEETCSSMIYNLKSRKLDLGNLKATNYKFNKLVNTPDPESPAIETLHQFRRTEARRVFNRATADNQP